MTQETEDGKRGNNTTCRWANLIGMVYNFSVGTPGLRRLYSSKENLLGSLTFECSLSPLLCVYKSQNEVILDTYSYQSSLNALSGL